jgi:hypothetical protein
MLQDDAPTHGLLRADAVRADLARRGRFAFPDG